MKTLILNGSFTLLKLIHSLQNVFWWLAKLHQGHAITSIDNQNGGIHSKQTLYDSKHTFIQMIISILSFFFNQTILWNSVNLMLENII